MAIIRYVITEHLRPEHAKPLPSTSDLPGTWNFVEVEIELGFVPQRPSARPLALCHRRSTGGIADEEIEYDHVLTEEEVREEARRAEDSYVAAHGLSDTRKPVLQTGAETMITMFDAVLEKAGELGRIAFHENLKRRDNPFTKHKWEWKPRGWDALAQEWDDAWRKAEEFYHEPEE